MRGKFITVEGGEGVGKSVFTKDLRAALEAKGINLVVTFEPGGTPTANRMREVFLTPPKEDPFLPEAEFCLVSAARAQHVGRKVIPALNAGSWVLCDRFADSARVYQGMLAGISERDVENLVTFTTFGLEPDLTFVLDCTVDVSLARLNKRGEHPAAQAVTRFDAAKKQSHEKIRQCFLNLRERFPNRIVVLNTDQDRAEILKEALKVIEERFHGQ